MTVLSTNHIFLLWIWLFKPTGAFLRSDLDVRGGVGTRRAVHCRDELEYLNGRICCLNCPAGTRLISPCSGAGEKGTCEECDYGTYTEHSNSLKQCFMCTRCRSDQDIVRACSHTLNTECRCKLGTFCPPDQACEVCRKCRSRCDKDEEVVRNCTPTANTVCKKIQDKSVVPSGAPLRGSVFFFFLGLISCVSIIPYSGDRPPDDGRNEESQRLSCSSLIKSRQTVRAKPSVHLEDERKVLCESLNSSASNSQHSLSGLCAYSFPATAPQASPTQPTRMNELLSLFAGEQSLRKCFDFFEDIDINYHKRFFRLLEIGDNAIRSKEHLPYEDRIHEYLNIWIEKRGMDASLNDLLKALLDVNQRRTAENIKEQALARGYYLCQEK
uniref:Uncharacterized protein n=1 Tax=Mola mola TaxID=94237 RepID=A0A3Q3WN87_MOLML